MGSSLKWTVLGQSGQFIGVKLDCPNDWNWKVMYQTEQSKRLKVGGLRKWTVQRVKTGRSKWVELDSLKNENERSPGMIVNGRKDKNWKVSRIVSIPFRIYSCNFLITVNPTVLVFNCWGENSIQFGPGSLIIRHRVILDIDSGWRTSHIRMMRICFNLTFLHLNSLSRGPF